MPAIITDQFRILNAETFAKSVTGIGTTSNFYYTFLAHPNPSNVTIEEYGDANWPVDPRDSFEQEDRYHDSMLFLKKIGVNDFARIVPRIDWSSGITYDMYRHDYDINNAAPQTSAKSLYESRYYILNSEFKVYICINNGSEPDNPNGIPSQVEPNFTSTVPQETTDGYMWKFLYEIPPAEVVKFATEKFMPLPANWGDSNTAAVKNAAVRGRIETVIIKDEGSGYTNGVFSKVPILGDGVGGEVSITITDGEVSKVEVTSPGKDYTRGLINYTDGNGQDSEFEVIIPPKGGHGADIYRELGSHRVMIYSKYDSSDDFITENNFSRIGIVRNPTVFQTSTDILNKDTATSLGALKLKPVGAGNTADTEYPLNGEIRQEVGTASSIAIGYVASWNKNTGVLRYYQPVGLSTISNNNFRNFDFEGDTTKVVNCVGMTDDALVPDTAFSASSINLSNKIVDLGQAFDKGKALPEVEKYSGDIIYIDNRAPISRSESQKEELKIVVEF